MGFDVYISEQTISVNLFVPFLLCLAGGIFRDSTGHCFVKHRTAKCRHTPHHIANPHSLIEYMRISGMYN